MYAELTRPMNERERKALLQWIQSTRAPVTLRGTLTGVGLGMGGIAFCIFLLWLLSWLLKWPVVFGLIGGVLGVIGVLCLYVAILSIQSHVHWSRHHRTFIESTLPSLRAAIEDGRVAVKHVVSSAVIELWQTEDEGDGYLFDVGNGTVLFLKGQQYDAAEGDDPWPNSEFEIVRTVHGEHFLGIFCRGHRLEPVRSISGEELRDEFLWETKEELRYGTLDQVESEVCRPSARKVVS